MDENEIILWISYFIVLSIFFAILISMNELFRIYIPKKRGRDVSHKYQTKKRILGIYIFFDLLFFCTAIFTDFIAI